MWKTVEEELPETGQKVYIVVEDKYKVGGKIQKNQTIAIWVKEYTILEEDFMDPDYWGEGDYLESEDKYYAKEGFYENTLEAEISYRIREYEYEKSYRKVTHWMSLIELP